MTRNDIILDGVLNEQAYSELLDSLVSFKNPSESLLMFVNSGRKYSSVLQVQGFLDDLEKYYYNSALGAGYVGDYRKLEIDVLKYSPATGIFYRQHNGKLYSYAGYKRDQGNVQKVEGALSKTISYIQSIIDWKESSYSDYYGMSEFWVDATDTQNGIHDLEKKWNNFLKEMEKQ